VNWKVSRQVNAAAHELLVLLSVPVASQVISVPMGCGDLGCDPRLATVTVAEAGTVSPANNVIMQKVFLDLCI
jgi:hypothetical protein